ncbi:MAG: NAD-dependent epimerase/dehydratase family protein [Dehalococcoidia bacterium]|nr:MAG: NAD-dependent epimerase/dehydratase family protein [Dehalococcoidia bacterium]
MAELHVVTGAFGFTGSRVARRLLDRGIAVRTLTGHADRASPLHDLVDIRPLQFADERQLAADLAGARVLYNTYWVRFPYHGVTYDTAVDNSRALVRAAQAAGVERIVHVSITNPDEASRFGYFRGKALVERAIRESTLSHAILRPAVLFGDQGILINNIAWLLRRFPLFVMPGSGEYRLQPIFVDDLAELAVEHGARADNTTTDAIGPETYTFDELVRAIAEVLHSRSRIVHTPPLLAFELSRIVGFLRRDVILTREEVDGLMANLLVTSSPPAGHTKLSEWLRANAATLGRAYQSELARHYR